MVFNWDSEWDDAKPGRKRISKKQREMLYHHQKERCMYCGKKNELPYMHVDHKTPLAQGGNDNPSNLQILCAPCNTRKGTLTDGVYRKKFKLTPSRQAKEPPTKVIPQKYFQDISKDISKKSTQKKAKAKASKAKQAKKQQEEDPWGFRNIFNFDDDW
tara:strand:- start:77 stop:550 length:474 start_codon:yes stop_codon:yes gene_type:complete